MWGENNAGGRCPSLTSLGMRIRVKSVVQWRPSGLPMSLTTTPPLQVVLHGFLLPFLDLFIFTSIGVLPDLCLYNMCACLMDLEAKRGQLGDSGVTEGCE